MFPRTVGASATAVMNGDRDRSGDRVGRGPVVMTVIRAAIGEGRGRRSFLRRPFPAVLRRMRLAARAGLSRVRAAPTAAGRGEHAAYPCQH